MSRLWILLHLLFLSWEDIRDRMLTFAMILELLLTGVLEALWSSRSVVWLPGLILLAVGKLGKEKIGLGDGWLILALGMWLSYEKLTGLLLMGLLLGTLYGILMGKREIPLVPFLTIGFLLTAGG